jgi:hypothetical protein
MAGSSPWVIYSGTAEIVLIAVLIAAAAAAVYAGFRLPLPARLPRPGLAAKIIMFAVWVLAMVALVGCVGVYEKQVLQAGLEHTPRSDPIAPITLIGVCVVFAVIALTHKARGWRVAVGSAVIGALAAPWIFEVPFDLIIMPRTHPVIDPGLYRVVLFTPLILTGIMTVVLVSLSPVARLHRVTLWCFAGMLAVYAVWALDGYSYPSGPGPVTLNAVSKILALVTALTLFLPQRDLPKTPEQAQEAAASRREPAAFAADRSS